jgi:hypothetical protein
MTGAPGGPRLIECSSYEFQAARQALTEFVREQASKAAADLGFGYVAQTDAPHTLESLKRAFEQSSQSGAPLPVSNEHSGSVIFTDPAVNFAMRFWHDVNHVGRQLTFDLVDELELSLWHLSVLEAAGFPPDGWEWQLLHADLVGQVYVMSLTRRFPLDQKRFAEGCIGSGFDRAILDEARRPS